MRHLRPIGYLVLVVLIFLAGDRLGASALSRLVAQSDFRFSRVYQGGLENDVLVIGNSRAVHSIFAPELAASLCRNVFNAAYNGMPGEIAEAIVEDYIEHNAPPKVVLIEISNAESDTDLAKEMRLFARYPGHLHDVVAKLDPWEPLWTALSHLYFFDNEMTLRALYYLHRSDQDWIMPDKPMTADVIAHMPTQKYRNLSPRRGSVEALTRLAHFLRDRHIEPVLYVAPYHPIYRKLVPHHDAWVAAFQKEVGPDLPIIDLSDRFNDNDYFADVQHTTLSGSRAVMAVLKERLQALLPKETASRCSAPAVAAASEHE